MLLMIDLDNTLVDRAGAVAEWAGEFVAEHALGFGAAEKIVELDRDGYSDRHTVFTAIRRQFGLETSVNALLDAYRSRVVEMTRLADGAVSCLGEMRDRGWSVVIVSNGSSGQQHAKIDATGIRELVDGVVVSGDLGIAKPDRRIFDIAATNVDRTIVGAWMVGDSPTNDIEGPAALGIRTAWIDRGRRWLGSVQPDVIVSALGELVDAIEAAPAVISGER